jgi:hypothetical protein
MSLTSWQAGLLMFSGAKASCNGCTIVLSNREAGLDKKSIVIFQLATQSKSEDVS